MDELIFEEAVRRIAARAAYPPTPQLRARVLDAIAAGRASAPSRTRQLAPSPILRFAIVASIAAAVVAIAVALSVPSSRSAIAEFFGIEGSRIELLPTPAPGVTPTPFPTPGGIESYATPSSLDGVQRDLGFSVALPAVEGGPPAVYVAVYFGFAVVLRYDAFDLWEVRLAGGTIGKGVPADDVFAKAVGGGTKIEDLTIKARPATWISGGAHIVRFIDADGREVAASVRTVGRNTLIWRTDDFFYRLETDLSEAEAIRIANSLP
jgi:hypothetical protein